MNPTGAFGLLHRLITVRSHDATPDDGGLWWWRAAGKLLTFELQLHEHDH